MPETSKPSAGAMELSKTICRKYDVGIERQGVFSHVLSDDALAHLIDAALAELVRTGKEALTEVADHFNLELADFEQINCPDCKDTLTQFSRALTPWEPESGGAK